LAPARYRRPLPSQPPIPDGATSAPREGLGGEWNSAAAVGQERPGPGDWMGPGRLPGGNNPEASVQSAQTSMGSGTPISLPSPSAALVAAQHRARQTRTTWCRLASAQTGRLPIPYFLCRGCPPLTPPRGYHARTRGEGVDTARDRAPLCHDTYRIRHCVPLLLAWNSWHTCQI